MKIEELKTNKKGITLVALVITVILLMILVGTAVKMAIDDNIMNKTEDFVEQEEQQIEEQKSLSNMVRNLYK